MLLIIISLIVGLIIKKVFEPKKANAQLLAVQTHINPLVLVPLLVSQTAQSSFASSTFEKIEWCESRGVATAQNQVSTASGCYQFLDSSWDYYGNELWGEHLKEHSKTNCTDSRILGAYVYGRNGTRDWTESMSCWAN